VVRRGVVGFAPALNGGILSSQKDRWASVRSDALLLALPLVATIVRFENVLRVLNAGPGGDVTSAFPTGMASLWSFVHVPKASGVVGNPIAFVVELVANAVPRRCPGLRSPNGSARVAGRQTSASRFRGPSRRC
jgi:hypothetical protein